MADAIAFSRWRTAGWALGGAVLVAGAIWLALMPAAEFAHQRRGAALVHLIGPTGVHLLFWAAAVFFAAGTLISAGRAVRGGDLVRIEADGIRYAAPLGSKLAPWSSVAMIQLTDMRAGFRTHRFIQLSPGRRLALTGISASTADVEDWIDRANAARPRR